jgi:hypothetical protein
MNPVIARSLLALALLTILFGAAPVAAHADEEPVSPDDIVEAGGLLDGQQVAMQGEAIGDSLRADAEHRWVNVLGGGTAIGVYMSDEMAERIAHLGIYTTFGDTVEVRGVVNSACTQHAGEFDVHAEEVMIAEEGGQRENPVSPWKAAVGLGLLFIGAIEYRVYRRLAERSPV